MQLRAGAVAAGGVRWCCEGALGVGGGWGCSGPVFSWSRDGGRVVDGFGAHGAALASAFEDSMVVWRWWGDGDREAARRSAAVAAASERSGAVRRGCGAVRRGVVWRGAAWCGMARCRCTSLSAVESYYLQ